MSESKEVHMSIPKRILDEVFEQMMAEYQEQSGRSVYTLDELEGKTLQFGQEFERRVLERSIEEQKKGAEKKTAKSARRGWKTSESGKGR
jgi:hypothetical protein